MVTTLKYAKHLNKPFGFLNPAESEFNNEFGNVIGAVLV
jgi:hypothetical protein